MPRQAEAGTARPRVRYSQIRCDAAAGRVAGWVRVLAPPALGKDVILAEEELVLTDRPAVERLAARAEQAYRTAANGQAKDLPPLDTEALQQLIGERARRELKPASEEEAPVPLPSDEAAPFPVQVLPAALHRYVLEIAESHHCPVDFPAGDLLTVAGAAVGAARCLAVSETWTEVPAIYSCQVGLPGDGKSPALRRIVRPLWHRQQELEDEFNSEWADYTEELADYDEKIAARRRKDNKDQADPRPVRPTPPVMRRLIAGDATVEALAPILLENPRGLLLVRDELTAWVGGMNQYRGGRGNDREFFLSAWSGESHIVDRKSMGENRRPLILPRVTLSVVGGLPPDKLPTLSDERNAEDGFVHRILFCYPAPLPPAPWSEKVTSPEAERAWERCLGYLWELQPEPPSRPGERIQPRTLRFTAAGKQAWVEWFNANAAEMAEPDFPPQLRGPWVKLQSYAARFGLILQLLRCALGEAQYQDVDEVSMYGAAALVDYFKSHTRKAYRQLRAEPEDKTAEQVLRWLESHGRKCSARDLVRAGVAGIQKQHRAQAALADLVDRGYGRLVTERRPRGPSCTIFYLASAAPAPLPISSSGGQPISNSGGEGGTHAETP